MVLALTAAGCAGQPPTSSSPALSDPRPTRGYPNLGLVPEVPEREAGPEELEATRADLRRDRVAALVADARVREGLGPLRAEIPPLSSETGAGETGAGGIVIPPAATAPAAADGEEVDLAPALGDFTPPLIPRQAALAATVSGQGTAADQSELRAAMQAWQRAQPARLVVVASPSAGMAGETLVGTLAAMGVNRDAIVTVGEAQWDPLYRAAAAPLRNPDQPVEIYLESLSPVR